MRRALVRADCKVADGDTTAMHLIIKSQSAKAESAPPVPTPHRLSDLDESEIARCGHPRLATRNDTDDGLAVR